MSLLHSHSRKTDDSDINLIILVTNGQQKKSTHEIYNQISIELVIFIELWKVFLKIMIKININQI